MKPRYIILGAGLFMCVLSVALISLKGKPADVADLKSISEVGESVLHHLDKTGQILTAVSDEEEIRIGDQIYRRGWADTRPKSEQDQKLESYVARVGQRVAENVKRRDIVYKFHVVDFPWANAFACVGGHIYVTKGLLKGLKSEAELAGVLGHEITHVDSKHCIGAIQYRILKEKIGRTNMDVLAEIGYQILFRPGYTEFQETEADQGGVFLASSAGYHPLALITAFENIKMTKRAPDRNDSITPVGETLRAIRGVHDRYFSTHPLTQDRIDKIRAYVKENKLLEDRRVYNVGAREYEDAVLIVERVYREEQGI
jgi:predicted Zn-dependent protease